MVYKDLLKVALARHVLKAKRDLFMVSPSIFTHITFNNFGGQRRKR